MSKQNLSRHQQGIVKRYYEHHETIQTNKLSELVSELWLAEGEASQAKLWGRAQTALMRLGLDARQVADVVNRRDLKALAALAAEADAGRPLTAPRGASGAGGPKGKWVGKGPEPKRAGAVSASDGRTISQARAEKAAASGFDSLEEDNLKRALRRFRDKLKRLRREDESRLGNRYVTYGKKSAITAITPPDEFPTAVWDKLVELKRLHRAGQGLLELPEDAAKRPKR